ncbi:MAG: hypothetical protein OXB84_02975, partial [Halobacteriovoraceae bacterium]|nr:hypothetical protein [Halobacteriovoraceae bacterium]
NSWPGIHPVEHYDLFIMGKVQGMVLSIHPYILKKMKIKGSFSIALIDLHEIENKPGRPKIKFKPWTAFPGSNFDWTVLCDKKTATGDILNSLKQVKIKELNQVKIVKIFSLNEKKNAVTLRASFTDLHKTLDNEFLKNAQDKLVATTEKEGFPLKT